jgi:L-alanine-DL-glutamate epimerase-like enolase superfamily enzyme
VMRPPFRVKDSYIELPTGPGLGVDLDERALARHPYAALPARALRQYSDEGP